MSTFVNEALHLVSNVQLVKSHLFWNERQIQHYLSLLWQEFTTRIITNAMPIDQPITKVNITTLVIRGLGGEHIHMQTYRRPHESDF